jgi:transposase
VVIEATGDAMAVVRALSPYVGRAIVANPLQVKAIAHAHVKTDKIDAGVLASLRAAGFLPEIWLPDTDTECRRRLVARRNQVVRHRTRIKNEVHAILHAHLVPPCPHAELFGRFGRIWLSNRSSPMTRPPPSTGTCANSIGSARIWLVSTGRSLAPTTKRPIRTGT